MNLVEKPLPPVNTDFDNGASVEPYAGADRLSDPVINVKFWRPLSFIVT